MEELYHEQMIDVMNTEDPIAKIVGLIERKSKKFVGTASLFIDESVSEQEGIKQARIIDVILESGRYDTHENKVRLINTLLDIGFLYGCKKEDITVDALY